MMNYSVVSYHIGRKIILRNVKEKLKYALIKKEHTFLLYRLDDYSFVYIKNYGSIAFFNCSESIKQELFSKAFDINSNLYKQFHQEKYKIIINDDNLLSIGFDFIELPQFTVDIAHIIMLNLAQSVALDHYYQESSELLESSSIYSKQLEKTGRIKLTRNKMRSYIGKTMNLKNKIAEELFIFDTSSLAWNTQELSEIDKRINEELNILERHHGLQHNLDVAKENLDLFKDILQHRHSSLLEWIIIILILFEVIPIIIEII